jgi:hypothetical protein
VINTILKDFSRTNNYKVVKMQTPRICVHRLFAACVESKKTNRNLVRGPALAKSINFIDWRRIFSESTIFAGIFHSSEGMKVMDKIWNFCGTVVFLGSVKLKI